MLFSYVTLAFVNYVLLFRSERNKAYSLKPGSFVLPVYCHMTDDLGACGDGGWKWMKMDGSQVFNEFYSYAQCIIYIINNWIIV